MSLYRYASPQTFYSLAGRMLPWFAMAAALLAAAGLVIGFLVAPTDFQQGEVYRIIFIHVPSAWMAMFVYLVMAGYAVLTLVLRARLSAMMTRAAVWIRMRSSSAIRSAGLTKMPPGRSVTLASMPAAMSPMIWSWRSCR